MRVLPTGASRVAGRSTSIEPARRKEPPQFLGHPFASKMTQTDRGTCAPPVRRDGETRAGGACRINRMSSTQLDILALEPFYGGVRRVMLDQVIHCSRHRWTVLKLPPRRIERRLTAAAHWFAEQLSRHWVGRVDMVFTNEGLELSDLYRLGAGPPEKPAGRFFSS